MVNWCLLCRHRQGGATYKRRGFVSGLLRCNDRIVFWHDEIVLSWHSLVNIQWFLYCTYLPVVLSFDAALLSLFFLHKHQILICLQRSLYQHTFFINADHDTYTTIFTLSKLWSAIFLHVTARADAQNKCFSASTIITMANFKVISFDLTAHLRKQQQLKFVIQSSIHL